MVIMIDPTHYKYSVQWSARDREFVGTVAEFPSLAWLDQSEREAFKGIKQIVADIVMEMIEGGEVPPTPLSERDFSGKLMLRIPPELHQRLATEAAENNISLNRLISSRLAKAG
jgi:predicted HicB family RNase H-like nuclease